MNQLENLPHCFAKAMENHDVETIESWVDPAYVQHNPYVPQGIPGVKFFIDAWNEAFTDTKVKVEDVIVSGDRVVGRFTFEATHTGSFLGVPATGKRIQMSSIDIWRVANGRFIEHWDEFNSAEFFQQIGGHPKVPTTK